MKKLDFYTQKMVNGKKAAVIVSGYTDGVYNYYKTDSGFWWAIHPGTGLGITTCTCSSRKTAVENAYDPYIIEKLENYFSTDHGKKAIENFNKLIEGVQ